MMAPRGEEENGAILAGWNIKRVAPSISVRKNHHKINAYRMTNLLQNGQVDGAIATTVDGHKGIGIVYWVYYISDHFCLFILWITHDFIVLYCK